MTFEIKIGNGSFNNIKKFHSDDELFTIFINKNAVNLPLNVAVSISSSITDVLLVDNTVRDFSVVIDFRNPENLNKIISIISSQNNFSKCTISDKKDALDFAEFGKIIGNEEFILPLLSIIKSDTSPLSSSNVIERIEEKTFLSDIDKICTNITNEVSYIKSHFSEVSKLQSFLDWCLRESNSSIVEEIVCSKDIRLASEDDLLSFIIRINGEFRYTHLFQYVRLEFCTLTKCREFIDYINSEEFFSSSNFRNSVLQCLSNRILYDYYSYKSINEYSSRYSKEFTDGIILNSSEHLKEEISKLKKEKPNQENEILKLKKENMKMKTKTNGIIHSLIEKYGKNPVDAGCIELSANGFTKTPDSRYTEHFGGNLKCIFDYDSNLGYYDSNRHDSNLIFDFKEMKCSVKNYEIKFGYDNGNKTKRFVLEGSNDKQSWITIDDQSNNNKEYKSFESVKYTSNGDSETCFRYIRLRVTKYWGGLCYLGLTSIEFFGDFE